MVHTIYTKYLMCTLGILYSYERKDPSMPFSLLITKSAMYRLTIHEAQLERLITPVEIYLSISL